MRWISSLSAVSPIELRGCDGPVLLVPSSMPVLQFFLCGLLLFAAGLTVAHQGPHERLDHATHSIAQQPESQELYLERGRIYAEVGQFDEARADFDRAAELGFAKLVAFDYGMLCYQMGDLSCARLHLDRYIDTFPSHAAAFEYRARIERDAGDYPLALADLERYLELQDKPSPGQFITASRMHEESGDSAGALSIIDQGIKRLGTVTQLQRRAIEIELSLGETGRAVQRWRSCRDVLKDSVSWKVEMAQLLVLDGQPAPASDLLREAAVELEGLKPTPARIKTGEEIRRLELQLQAMRAGEGTGDPGGAPAQ